MRRYLGRVKRAVLGLPDPAPAPVVIVEPPPDPSQAGEWALLDKLVRERQRGERFLVDVGAHDGRTISNSAPFIDQGWRAVMVEPGPAIFPLLKEAHGSNPNVHCFQVACSNEDGEADFFIGTDGEQGFRSTLSRDENEWFDFARSDQSVRVRVRRLIDILEEVRAPKHFALLMVDAEGMDYEVFQGMDLRAYRPDIVVTEEYELNKAKHAAKYSHLIQNDYGLVQKIGANTIWIDRLKD